MPVSTRENVSFHQNRYIVDGERNFRSERYEKALTCFTDFVEVNPHGEAFVAGRISLTLMKLRRFKEAMQFLKKSIQAAPHKEKDYLWLYAECLYGMGYVKEAEKLCMDIRRKYPEMSWDALNLFKKVSIHPHLDVIMQTEDTSDRAETLKVKAMDDVIKILVSQREYDEAYQYSVNLLNNPRNTSATPYLCMADYYLRMKTQTNCGELLAKLESASMPEEEKQRAFKYVLSIYRLSPDFEYSKYHAKSQLKKWMETIFEKTNEAITSIRFSYQPVMNLDYYFDHEPVAARY